MNYDEVKCLAMAPQPEIGQIVRFRHKGARWTGQVIDIVGPEHTLAVAVLGFRSMFYMSPAELDPA